MTMPEPMEALLHPGLIRVRDDERALLNRLRQVLEDAGVEAATVASVEDVARHLDALFLVVVVGEFNAGKSSVLNALFGEPVMEEGPIPTTAKVTILRYGEERMDRQLSEYLVERRYPSPLLRALHLVDTPGTNSIIRRHQEITEQFIPRADLVLFVTSYDRPLTESERQFLTFIREAWGKRLVFVLNKADLARSDEALAQVLEHIRSGCRELMDLEPRIFPVSADLAFRAKTTDDPARRAEWWAQSRFEPLETFITQTLAGPDQLRLKLMSPLDTAARLLAALEARLHQRRTVLAEDERRLAALRERLAATRAELADGYRRYIAEVDTLLLEVERRGVQFLTDTIRVSQIGLLRDRDRFREEFARQVLRTTDHQIEQTVTAAVDWLLKRALALWTQTLTEFHEKMQAAGGAAATAAQAGFAYNRQEVFDAIMRETSRRLETHDLSEEARRILSNVQSGVDTVQMAGAGAASLGVLSGVLLAATTLDAVGGFGLASSAVLAAAGLTVLPRQRRKAIAELRDRIEGLRSDVEQALTRQFDQQIAETLGKLEATLEPYTRLIERERSETDRLEAEHAALRQETERLRHAVREQAGDADDALAG